MPTLKSLMAFESLAVVAYIGLITAAAALVSLAY